MYKKGAAGFGSVECAAEQTGKEAALKSLYPGQCCMGALSERGKGRIGMGWLCERFPAPTRHTDQNAQIPESPSEPSEMS